MDQERKDALNRKARWILAGCGLFIVGVGSLYAAAMRSAGKVDPTTMCLVDEKPPEHVVVLIDRTDTMSRRLARVIFDDVNRLKETLPKHGMLSIYMIDGDSDELMAPEFCLCNPGNGDDANWLYRNPKLLRKKWDETFGEPLRASLGQLYDQEESATSPIIEAILSVSSLQRVRAAEELRLVIYSDMIQNMPGYSHFRTFGDPQEVAAAQADEFSSLHSAEVQVRYIQRERYRRLQTSRHREFWDEFLKLLGARHVSLVPVTG